MRSNDPFDEVVQAFDEVSDLFDEVVEAFDEVNEGLVEVRDVVDVGKGDETINYGESRFRRRCRRKAAKRLGMVSRTAPDI